MESANALATIPADSEGALVLGGGRAWRALVPPTHSLPASPPLSLSLLSAFAGREALIPLTPSLFVPGTLGASGEVLVDIGTGFFVGKTAAEAVALLRARAEAVGGEVGALARVAAIKESNREIIQQRLSMFEAAQQQQQQQQQQQS